MMFKVRKRLPSQKLSAVKSIDHLLFGPFGAGMGALKPMPLRFLFLRLGSCNSSSRYKRSTLLWFIAPKSRRIRMVSLGLPNRGRSAASLRSRSRRVSSSFFFSLYLYVFRFCPARLHALRSLRPVDFIVSTAFLWPAGLRAFFRVLPSMPGWTVPVQPPASLTAGFPFPRLSSAGPPKLSCLRTLPSSYRKSDRLSRALGKSPTLIPDSCCWRIFTICSSVNRVFFICRPPGMSSS